MKVELFSLGLIDLNHLIYISDKI